jgi:two-component system OmpR family response regulator
VNDPRHILVVDDNDHVRQTVVDQLLVLGYRVSVADGGESMRAFLDAPDPIDLIVLDAVMPGEKSPSLALHAKERGIRLVMISGSVEHIRKALGNADQLLQKPFRMARPCACNRTRAGKRYGRSTSRRSRIGPP